MNISTQRLRLEKRYPLRISRGVTTGTTSLFVSVTADGHTGWGEMCPGQLTGAETAEEGEADLRRLLDSNIDGLSIQQIWARGRELEIAPCVQAALDMALWDHLGKQAGLPLWRLLGLTRPTVPTSITMGINPPEIIRERIPEMFERTGCKFLKIKLGSNDGLEADQEIYQTCRDAAKPFNVGLRVDANGGWDVDGAKQMMAWLAERDCDYVEQPLPKGAEDDLPRLFDGRPLPLYVDESCVTSHDIPTWAHAVDGCNLKLMKCGGITEALRIIATARAFGLGTMIGCNGESSISIAAGAALGALFDHIDLDSHLNLNPDPAEGASLIDGIVMPTDRPGHGARLLSC